MVVPLADRVFKSRFLTRVVCKVARSRCLWALLRTWEPVRKVLKTGLLVLGLPIDTIACPRISDRGLSDFPFVRLDQ